MSIFLILFLFQVDDNVFTLSFRYRTLGDVRATAYFAFTFPYSYQDLMSSLRGFDKRFKNCIPAEKYFPGQGLGKMSSFFCVIEFSQSVPVNLT